MSRFDEVNREAARKARPRPPAVRLARLGKVLKGGPALGLVVVEALCGWTGCGARIGRLMASAEGVDLVAPDGYHRGRDGVWRPTRRSLRRGPDPEAGRRRRARGSGLERDRRVLQVAGGTLPATVECPRCGNRSRVVADLVAPVAPALAP